MVWNYLELNLVENKKEWWEPLDFTGVREIYSVGCMDYNFTLLVDSGYWPRGKNVHRSSLNRQNTAAAEVYSVCALPWPSSPFGGRRKPLACCSGIRDQSLWKSAGNVEWRWINLDSMDARIAFELLERTTFARNHQKSFVFDGWNHMKPYETMLKPCLPHGSMVPEPPRRMAWWVPRGSFPSPTRPSGCSITRGYSMVLKSSWINVVTLMTDISYTLA